MKYIEGIEKAFKEYIGENSIDELKRSITEKPMILIAGDQLTGKSTQAKRLSKIYNGKNLSVGTLFREEAKKRGVSVAEQARLLKKERGIDVQIDYSTCKMIGGAELDSDLAVIEGRQPAFMGGFMESIGKDNLVRIYLECSVREQALRFLKRETTKEDYLFVKENLPKEDFGNLEDVAKEINGMEIPNTESVMDAFIDNQNRDEDDRERYHKLYGFDYRDASGYDIIINTNDKEVGDVAKEINESIEKHDSVWIERRP